MIQVHHADCLEHMRTMEPGSVHSIVTDPPYGLSFMGKDWDHGVPGFHFWEEALRVAKPGAHLLAFGGTRTFHRLAVAIEDAGWEIRDTLMWVYGSGFPKSHNVAVAIDKEHGAPHRGRALNVAGRGTRADIQGPEANPDGRNMEPYTPATDAAKQWQGWGTALKPAWEPIIMARKPLVGTVARNVQEHGTGAINVDGCRVPAPDGVPQFEHKKNPSANCYGDGLHGSKSTGEVDTTTGRWPANVIHDGSEEVVGMFPAEAGGGNHQYNRDKPDGRKGQVYGGYGHAEKGVSVGKGDSGSAARFFYVAKASKEDRDEGLNGFALVKSGAMSGPETRPGKPTNHPLRANNHPTVKPTDLMRYLCRLVTPPDGIVFDPFMGSGSTGKAAALEGFSFIGCDLQSEYVEIARARIQHAQRERINYLGLFAPIEPAA